MESQVQIAETKLKTAWGPMIKDIIKHGLIVNACIAIIILIILDISPVVKVLKNDSNVMPELMMRGLPEIQRIKSCNNNDPVSNGFAEGWRQCALKVFKEIDSPLMVQVAAGVSILWLEDHPEDVAIRDAAQEMIQRSRNKMVDDWPTVYARLERIDRAVDGSVIAGALGLKGNHGSIYEKFLKELNHSELGLFNPKEFSRQEDWMAQMRDGIQRREDAMK